MALQLLIGREVIADFCHRHHIRQPALFGSVTRDDFGPDSDVDFLIEFQPGLMTLGGMEVEIVGRAGAH